MGKCCHVSDVREACGIHDGYDRAIGNAFVGGKLQGKVRVVSDGHFRIQIALGETSAIFFLNPGDVFYGPPDHHQTESFRLKEILRDGAMMTYESKLDHRSFGKNLLTIDQGAFKVNWK